LIKNGADVSICDKRGWNVFHFAVRTGENIKCLELLLKSTNDPKIINQQSIKLKETPLMLAVDFQDLKNVKFLVEQAKADFSLVDVSGDFALHSASKLSNLEIVKTLLPENYKDSNDLFCTEDGVGLTVFDCSLLVLGESLHSQRTNLNAAGPRRRKGMSLVGGGTSVIDEKLGVMEYLRKKQGSRRKFANTSVVRSVTELMTEQAKVETNNINRRKAANIDEPTSFQFWQQKIPKAVTRFFRNKQ